MLLEYVIRLNIESIIVCVFVEELYFMIVTLGFFLDLCMRKRKGKVVY